MRISVLRNCIITILLSNSFLNINAQEQKYIDDNVLYTRIDGLLYRDSQDNRFYKLDEYLVPFTVTDLDKITVKGVDASIVYRISTSLDRDTVALFIGTEDELN